MSLRLSPKKLSSFAQVLPEERYSRWFLFDDWGWLQGLTIAKVSAIFENDVTSQFFCVQFYPLS